MIEVDEGVGGPEPALQLVPGHYLAGTFQQHGKNLERLFLQSDPGPVTFQLSSLEIYFEDAKLDYPRAVAARYRH
jgi:hypothetical protein